VMESHMKSLEHNLVSLLSYDRVLTISKTDDGWMVGFSDAEQEDGELYFVPSVMLTTQATLAEALSAFESHQSMIRVRGFQA
jgi:hypothetical protein